MKRFLPLAFLLCAFHGGDSSCAGSGCAHMSSGGSHYSGGGHSGGGEPSYYAPSGGGHSIGPVTSSSAPRVSPQAVLASPPPPAMVSVPHSSFRLRQAVETVGEAIESVGEALGDLALYPADTADPGIGKPDSDDDGMCRSYVDCQDGALGHGALCDRTFRGGDPGAVGVCREACRDDHDCPALMRCEAKLDPQDWSWAGCVP